MSVGVREGSVKLLKKDFEGIRGVSVRLDQTGLESK